MNCNGCGLTLEPAEIQNPKNHRESKIFCDFCVAAEIREGIKKATSHALTGFVSMDLFAGGGSSGYTPEA